MEKSRAFHVLVASELLVFNLKTLNIEGYILFQFYSNRKTNIVSSLFIRMQINSQKNLEVIRLQIDIILFFSNINYQRRKSYLSFI